MHRGEGFDVLGYVDGHSLAQALHHAAAVVGEADEHVDVGGIL